MAKNPQRLYLRRRGEVWHLKFPIPRALRHRYLSENGKPISHKEVSLGTRDLAEANRAKHHYIARWVEEFKTQQRKELTGLPGEAVAIREELREVGADVDAADTIKSRAADRAEEIYVKAGGTLAGEHDEQDTSSEAFRTAKSWHNLATSEGPTFREAWAKWSEENGHDPSTKLKDEQALRGVLDFLAVADIVPDEITPEKARAYARWLNAEATSARGGPLAWATKDARLAPLRIFWTDYLEHNELVSSGINPWRGLKLTGKRNVKGKRPYTDAELLSILNGPEMPESDGVRYPRRTQMELYALTLYTGARIGEIANRYLGEVEKIPGGYCLHIGKSKTDAGVRPVPIVHPIPVAVLKRRIGTRTDPKAQLFAEFIPGGPKGSLGWYPSKALGRYRDKVGLGEATDTHSTRRRLITDLVNKGHPLTLVQFYVGHKPPGVTAGIYAKATTKGLRSVAQAIRYPAKIERAFRLALGLK